MDERVMRWINGWPEGLAPTMHFFSEATGYGWVRAVLVAFAIGMIAAGSRTRAAAIGALIAFPLANGATDAFKHLLPELRPYQRFSDIVVHTVGKLPAYGTGVHDAANFGTASAHSANMAAVATVFCIRLGWWGSPAVVIAVLTGLSRIYLGAHFPSQVVLGWACGVIAGFAVVKTWDLVARRRATPERSLEQS